MADPAIFSIFHHPSYPARPPGPAAAEAAPVPAPVGQAPVSVSPPVEPPCDPVPPELPDLADVDDAPEPEAAPAIAEQAPASVSAPVEPACDPALPELPDLVDADDAPAPVAAPAIAEQPSASVSAPVEPACDPVLPELAKADDMPAPVATPDLELAPVTLREPQSEDPATIVPDDRLSEAPIPELEAVAPPPPSVETPPSVPRGPDVARPAAITRVLSTATGRFRRVKRWDGWPARGRRRMDWRHRGAMMVETAIFRMFRSAPPAAPSEPVKTEIQPAASSAEPVTVTNQPADTYRDSRQSRRAAAAARPVVAPDLAIPGIPMEADQLGLANPIIITLLARLQKGPAIELDARHSGIYRPQDFRTAPWTGFAYDQAEDGGTGMAAGTRILTSRGEMEVENLRPGDGALTLREPALLPINWIGKSHPVGAPIVIEAGALGPDLPRRMLCLAPNQPVFVEPFPIPASRLVNGTTIRRLDSIEMDFFHVDVGRSEILFAEGLPVASSDRTRVQAA